MKILEKNEKEELLIQLDETKNGNVTLDISQFEKVWKMPGQDIDSLRIYKNLIKPWKGLVVQIDDKIYRLVKVDRYKKPGITKEMFEKYPVQVWQRNKWIAYTGLLVPSKKWTDNMEIIYSKEKERNEL